MNCGEFERHLQELEDSGPSPRMEAHRQACRACSELLEDLNSITRQARLILPREEPSERVWQEIRRRLQQEGLIQGPSQHVFHPQMAGGGGWFARLRMGMAYAAVFLVAFGVVYAYSIRSSVPVPSREVQTPMTNALALAEESPSSPDEPIWQLIEKVPPEKRATYVTNLQQVNSSIQQLNTFLATHPEDWFAREQLFTVYQQKERLWETLLNWEEF